MVHSFRKREYLIDIIWGSQGSWDNNPDDDNNDSDDGYYNDIISHLWNSNNKQLYKEHPIIPNLPIRK